MSRPFSLFLPPSVGTTRGQGIVVVVTFFLDSHFWKISKTNKVRPKYGPFDLNSQYLNLSLLSVAEFIAYPIA